nr:YhgE/Pip domain-containing protein [Loigolactobacillus coryniformis]
MVKNEWRFIRHNRLILLSVIVMTLIPFLYSVFFLKSVWDPYGETKSLPVAVVNQDQPVKYNGETLNVGKQTVQKLKNNNQLGWRFVSAKQAAQGLKDKKYYTVITLPKNFSANATTALNKNPKKMQLTYKTNDSLNYIGEVISQVGTTALDKEIRAAVTNAYASAMFDQLHVVGKGMNTAAKGATQLDNGLVTLNDGLGQYTVAVSQVNDGVQTLNVSVKPLASGLGAYTAGVGQLADGIGTLQSSVGPLASGVQQLSTGSNQLNTGINTYTGAVGQLADGIGTLQSNVGPLANGVGQLADGGNQLTAKSNELNTGAQQVAGGIGQLKAKTTGLSSSINELSTGLQQLDSGSKAVSSGILQINQGIAKQDAQLTDLNNGLEQMKTGLTDLNTQVNDPTTAAQITALQQQVSGLQSAVTTTTNSLTTIGTNTATTVEAVQKSVATVQTSDLDDAQKATILSELNKIGTAQQSNQDELQNIQTALKPLASIDVGQLQKLAANIQLLKSAINQLYAGYVTGTDKQPALYAGGVSAINGLLDVEKNTSSTSTLYVGSTQITAGVEKIITKVEPLAASVPTLTSGIDQLASGSSQLASGVSQYTDGTGKVASGLNTMNGQVPTLISGVGQLYTGSQTLNANSGSLNSGANQLAAGLNTMNGQVPTLVSGVGQLYTGSQTLNANSGALNTGASQLTAGVAQLADGTSQLNAKSPELTDGGGQLNAGSKKLAVALTAGGKKVNGIQTTAKTADMFASPTKLNHKRYSYVPNYGHALAPYVLSLALYVGAIVFNFAYPIRKISTKGQSATAWFFSKVSVGGVVAIVMAVLEASLMLAFGLQVDHIGAFYLIAIIFALASMFLVMLLSMAFDNPGRFVAMVLLMLQLGGSGGTFPMEITNSFYNAIHPYIPMTYSILGFRQAITSGLGSGQIWSSTGVLVGILVVSLLLLWWIMQILQRIHLSGVSQLDENQKLQKLEQ